MTEPLSERWDWLNENPTGIHPGAADATRKSAVLPSEGRDVTGYHPPVRP